MKEMVFIEKILKRSQIH